MRESTKRHIFTAGRVGPVALFFILLHLGAHQQHNTPQTKFWFIDRLNILLFSSCIFYNRAIKLFNSRQMIVAITKVIRNFFSLKTNENERKKERRGAWSCIDFSKATAHIVSQKENIKCLGSGCVAVAVLREVRGGCVPWTFLNDHQQAVNAVGCSERVQPHHPITCGLW